jgi:hypothetical protein
MHGKTNDWLSAKEATNQIHVDAFELIHVGWCFRCAEAEQR